LLVPALLVILMVLLRIPALPALLAGGLIGMLCAFFFQHMPVKEILSSSQSGYVCQTGVAAVDDLLSRGGMESMLSTIALIMCALSFGGILEKIGILSVLASAILKAARNTGMLVLSTILTCIGMNIIAPDQYLSIVVPGRMYRSAYQRSNLKAKNLSRALEDAGTLSSPLIPWNTCGAYMWVTLGVHPFVYLPFAFLNLINPLVSILLGFTGLTMEKESEEELKKVKESQ
jgi:NhaC family Na+:H+ antiporter